MSFASFIEFACLVSNHHENSHQNAFDRTLTLPLYFIELWCFTKIIAWIHKKSLFVESNIFQFGGFSVASNCRCWCFSVQQLPLEWDVGVEYHQNYFGWVKPVTEIASRFSPGCHVNVTPQKMFQENGKSPKSPKMVQVKVAQKKKAWGIRGSRSQFEESLINLVCCSSNLVFVPEWMYPGYLEDDRGSIETCFVSTGCTDLYGITTVMAGFVFLRRFFSATIIPQKQSQQAIVWVPMFSNLTQKNGTTKHLQSIVSCSEAHAVIIVDTQAAPALVGHWSSGVSQKAERGKGILFLWVILRQLEIQVIIPDLILQIIFSTTVSRVPKSCCSFEMSWGINISPQILHFYGPYPQMFSSGLVHDNDQKWCAPGIKTHCERYPKYHRGRWWLRCSEDGWKGDENCTRTSNGQQTLRQL